MVNANKISAIADIAKVGLIGGALVGGGILIAKLLKKYKDTDLGMIFENLKNLPEHFRDIRNSDLPFFQKIAMYPLGILGFSRKNFNYIDGEFQGFNFSGIGKTLEQNPFQFQLPEGDSFDLGIGDNPISDFAYLRDNPIDIELLYSQVMKPNPFTTKIEEM